MLTFTVFGVAQSKGSMRAFTPRGMKFPIVTDSNRKAKAWAQLVAEGASRALGQQLEPKMLTTPPIQASRYCLLPAAAQTLRQARRAPDRAPHRAGHRQASCAVCSTRSPRCCTSMTRKSPKSSR